MKKLLYIIPVIISFAIVGCGKKSAEEPVPKEEENKLEPTLAMKFERSSLNGIGFTDIVFAPDGRAAALSVKKEVFFSDNDGASWQLVRKYSTLNNDTTIQSLALHPTEDIIFLGASFLHNFNSYLRNCLNLCYKIFYRLFLSETRQILQG